MRKLQRISVLFLVIVVWVTAVFSVSAATQVKDGLDITVKTDKQKYETNEKITVGVTVKNTNSVGVDNVLVECVIPTGYKAEGNASLTIPTLASGEQKTLTVGLVPVTESAPETGDSSSVLLWSILAIMAVVTLVVVCPKLRKGPNSMLALLLCVAMALPSLPMGSLDARAENTPVSASVTETVEVGSEKLTIEGKVTYNAFVIEEEDNSGSETEGTEPGGDETEGTEPEGTTEESTEGTESEGTTEESTEGTEPSETTEESTEGTEPSDDETDEKIEVFVSPDGDDNNSGTLDEPVKTLEGARDRVRQLKAERKDARESEVPVTVYLRGGEYVLNRTFTLAQEDGGTAAAPVVYRAYQQEKVIITGSRSYDFSEFEPVTGEMKEKLQPAARDHVVVADIAALGLSPIQIGIIDSCQIDAPIMMLDESPMILTRYPNDISAAYWMKAVSESPVWNIGGGGASVTLNIDDDLMWSWDYNTEDFIYNGFAAFAWYGDVFRGTQDRANKQVTSIGKTKYGSKSGEKPLRVFNAYQSIDEPGEWYYDKDEQKLYMYPHEGATEESRLYVTESNYNLISIENAAYISIEGLNVTSSAQNGIVMTGAKNCVVNNCRLYGFEGRAFDISETGGTTNSGIKNSDIAYTASSLLGIYDGNKDTMTPGNNYASNNLIHDGQLYRQAEKSAIGFGGVGTKFDHNEVYNIPLMAITISTLDGVIEYNKFHDCNINGQDMGVLYAWKSANVLGNVIRYNHFYDLGNGADYNDRDGGIAIYLDEGTSGTLVENNIIGPGASGYQALGHINNGNGNTYTNNLLIDMDRMIRINKHVDTDVEFAKFMLDMYYINNIIDNELYTNRWSWIAGIRAYKNNVTPLPSIYVPNTVTNNVLIAIDSELRTGSMYYMDTGLGNIPVNGIGSIGGNSEADTNLYIAKDQYDGDNRNLFEDYDNGDYRLKEEVLALTGFENIDQSGIGMQTFVYDGKELLPGGNKPVASEVSILDAENDTVISDKINSGSTIKVLYTFTDADGDKEGSTIVEIWESATSDPFYLNWSKISRKISETGVINGYYVSEDCEGKWLRCKVIPVDEHNVQGEAVWTEPVYVEPTTKVDTTELETLLDNAEDLRTTVTIGDGDKQWKKSDVDAFDAAIEAAKAVMKQQTLLPSQYNEALKAFKDAYDTFLKSQINIVAPNIVKLGEMLSDTENWIASDNVIYSIKNGVISVSNVDTAWKQVVYDKTYSNTMFEFQYKHTIDSQKYGGFFLDLDSSYPDALWTGTSVAVVLGNGGTAGGDTELQIYGDADESIARVHYNEFHFENGKAYTIKFGMYAISASTVRIELWVDNTELFKIDVQDKNFVSAKSRFCVSTSGGRVNIAIGDDVEDVSTENPDIPDIPEPVIEYVDVGSLLADQENWKKTDGATTVLNADGSMTITASSFWSDVVVYDKLYADKVFRFKYQYNKGTSDGKIGFIFNLDKAGESILEKYGGGNQIFTYYDGSRMYVRTKLEGTVTTLSQPLVNLEDGKTYDIAFGMYDLSNNTVRIILSIENAGESVLLYETDLKDATLVGAEGRMSFIVDTGCEVTVSPASSDEPGGEGTIDYVDVGSLLADQENWKKTAGATTVLNADGSMTITASSFWSDVVVYDKLYADKVFRFKYQYNKGTSDGKIGFIFNLDKAGESILEKYGGGNQIFTYYDGSRMYVRTKLEGTVTTLSQPLVNLEDGKTYDIAFGMYDLSNNTVRIILSIENAGESVLLYEKDLEDATLVGAEGRMSFIVDTGCEVTVSSIGS